MLFSCYMVAIQERPSSEIGFVSTWQSLWRMAVQGVYAPVMRFREPGAIPKIPSDFD